MTNRIKIKENESLIIDVSCGCSYSMNPLQELLIISHCSKHKRASQEQDRNLTAFNNALFEEIKPTLKTKGLTKKEKDKELARIKSSMKEGLKLVGMLGEPKDFMEQKELCPYCKSDKLELGKVKPKLYKCMNCKRELMKPLTIGGKSDIEDLFKF